MILAQNHNVEKTWGLESEPIFDALEILTNKNTKMKTKIICAILIFVYASSCSKIREEIENEPDKEQILVENSPWTFSSYENSFVEDDGGSKLSNEEIQNDMNQYLVGVRFTFNTDRTGFLDIPEQDREDWVWTLSEDHLTTISDLQTDQYTFFNVDKNQMTFESRTITMHTKDSAHYEVTHVGKYFFN